MGAMDCVLGIGGIFCEYSNNAGVVSHVHGLAVEIELHAFATQRVFDDRHDVAVFRRQELRTALYYMHAAAEAHEGLCQLHAHRSAAQYDQLRHGHAQIEHVFVGEIGNAIETWEGRHGGTRASGDAEVSYGDVAAVDLKAVAVAEAAGAEDHLDAHGAKPFGAVVRFDGAEHGAHVRHHRGEAHGRVVRRKTAGVRRAHALRDVRRVQQGLARHTTRPQANTAETKKNEERHQNPQRGTARRDD